jgi:glycosyltransferase involved in cell wall biosynthesis
VRLVVYTDYLYRERDGQVFGERAFVRFLGALARQLGGLRLLGRLDRGPGPAHYLLDDAIEFTALPHYQRLTQIGPVARSVPGTIATMWRALDDADAVLSLGPYPHAIVLALIALIRRRRLVLGVRQDFPAYVRHRHPRQRSLQLAASLLEGCWRAIALRVPVIAVGPDLAARYRRSPRVLDAAISLIRAADVEAGARAADRTYDTERLQLLTVGRIDAEKNPLLLPEVLALLREQEPRWRLIVCGEGDLVDALVARVAELGLADHCEVRGYVPLDGGLLDLYRESHAFLHVSRTEGLPQVLIEAYASGLPSVATAVGGVRALGDCSELVPPDDAVAAAGAVQRLIDDSALRERLVAAGLARARRSTLEAQAGEVGRFIGK